MGRDILFYRAMRFLKSVVKSDKPVRVHRLALGDDYDGVCIERKDYFLIKVNKSLSVSHGIDVMIHEFAHVEAWEKESDPHGVIWGKCYSRIYREYLSGFLNR